MLLSRVHWATHLFCPHTLRNRMIFRRKNWKCIISVFTKLPLSLVATASITLAQLGGGREALDKDVRAWPNTLTLVYVSFVFWGRPLWKDFRDLWRPERLSLASSVSWSSDPPDWAKNSSAQSISSREATTLLAGRRQSMGIQHFPWYISITWCMVN